MKRRTGRRASLVVMARQPVAGRVKSRLASEIGTVRAAWWYRHNLRRVIRRLRRDPRWDLWIAVTPDAACARPFWLDGVRALPQGAGSLGERMERILSGMRAGPVLVIGSDIPGVRPGAAARAFRALGSVSVVLGPSGDGGYWAIGHRASVRRLRSGSLAGVRWSSAHALEDTRRALRGEGRIALVDVLNDVDRAADLLRQKGSGRPASAPGADCGAAGRAVIPARGTV